MVALYDVIVNGGDTHPPRPAIAWYIRSDCMGCVPAFWSFSPWMSSNGALRSASFNACVKGESLVYLARSGHHAVRFSHAMESRTMHVAVKKKKKSKQVARLHRVPVVTFLRLKAVRCEGAVVGTAACDSRREEVSVRQEVRGHEGAVGMTAHCNLSRLGHATSYHLGARLRSKPVRSSTTQSGDHVKCTA
eukprot:SAG11_NODE_563_length_8516_cov_11.669122_6_plen_191_part_00